MNGWERKKALLICFLFDGGGEEKRKEDVRKGWKERSEGGEGERGSRCVAGQVNGWK